MAVLTVTSKGQVTLRKEVLKHLGIKPGEKIELNLLPQNSVQLSRKPTGSLQSVFGILKGKSKQETAVTIEEMNEVIAKGWSGRL